VDESIHASAVSAQGDSFKACSESGATVEVCQNMTKLILDAKELKAGTEVTENDVRDMTEEGAALDTTDFAAACTQAQDGGEAGACSGEKLYISSEASKGVPLTSISRRAKSSATKQGQQMVKGITKMTQEAQEACATGDTKPSVDDPDFVTCVKDEAGDQMKNVRSEGGTRTVANADKRLAVDMDEAKTKQVGSYLKATGYSASSLEQMKTMDIPKMGNSTDLTNSLLKLKADVYRSVKDCVNKTACKEAAIEMSKKFGGDKMQSREDQSMNSKREATEVHMACKDGGGSNSVCTAEAKEAFVQAGGKSADWDSFDANSAPGTVKQLVETSSIGKRQGKATKIFYQRALSVELDAQAACSTIDDASTKTKMSDEFTKALEVPESELAGLSVSFQDKTDSSDGASCTLRFKAKAPKVTNDTKFEVAAKLLDGAVKAQTTRRAEVATSTYAAQETTECPETGCILAAETDTPTSSPTFAAGQTATPTAAPTIPEGGVTIEQVFAFSTLLLSDWTTDVQAVYETGFGINIGIYDETAKAFKTGCSVSSSASRRGLSVSFKAVASAEHASTAKAAAATSDATAMVANIAKASTHLGKTVPIPSAASVTAQAAVTQTAPSSSSSSGGLSTVVIVVIIVVAVLLVVVAIGVGIFFAMSKTTAPAPEDPVKPTKTDEVPAEVGVEPGDSTTLEVVDSAPTIEMEKVSEPEQEQEPEPLMLPVGSAADAGTPARRCC